MKLELTTAQAVLLAGLLGEVNADPSTGVYDLYESVLDLLPRSVEQRVLALSDTAIRLQPDLIKLIKEYA